MNGRMEVDNKRDIHTEEVLSNLPDFVSEWNLTLQASRKTSSTRRDYIYKIQKFLKSINDNTFAIKSADITYSSVIKYFTSIQRKQNANGTWVNTSDSYQATVWACLDNFLEFMYKRNYISQNYMELIDKPKNRDLDRINEHRVLLTKDDFSEIQLAVKCGAGNDLARAHQENTKERDGAIMVLFMTTGIRCTALSEINMEDLDIENRTLSVIDKREKRHIYKLSEQVMNTLEQWIAVRESYNDDNSPALFITRHGRLSQSGIAKIVKKYTNEAVGKELSPHKLRAGYVSILYNETHDAEFCRRSVGHSNLATTQRYIVTNNNEKERANEIISSFLI